MTRMRGGGFSDFEYLSRRAGIRILIFAFLLWDHESGALLGDADARQGAPVELQEVALDAVREDDSPGGHLRLDEQVLPLRHHAKDQLRLRGFAGEWLAHRPGERAVFPGEMRPFFGCGAESAGDPAHHVEDARHPTGRPGSRRDDDPAR